MSERIRGRHSAAALRSRQEGLERFERWDAEQPASLDPSGALRAVVAAYRLLPQSSRDLLEDPDYLGVREMHSALRRWNAASHGA